MKSGFIAIIGRPNVGKSTILNALINRKVSIVTNKAQTTRDNIKGIFEDDESQIIFVDTPGIHKPHHELGRIMNQSALSSTSDVEAAILVVDASKSFGDGDEYLVSELKLNCPLIVVLNKIDLAKIDEVQALKDRYQQLYKDAIIIVTVGGKAEHYTPQGMYETTIGELLRSLTLSLKVNQIEVKELIAVHNSDDLTKEELTQISEKIKRTLNIS